MSPIITVTLLQLSFLITRNEVIKNWKYTHTLKNREEEEEEKRKFIFTRDTGQDDETKKNFNTLDQVRNFT